MGKMERRMRRFSLSQHEARRRPPMPPHDAVAYDHTEIQACACGQPATHVGALIELPDTFLYSFTCSDECRRHVAEQARNHFGVDIRQGGPENKTLPSLLPVLLEVAAAARALLAAGPTTQTTSALAAALDALDDASDPEVTHAEST